jgi:hypothetical protein
MERRVSRVWSSMSGASLEGRSETALERVVGSRFWMFLRMTTRSGGRADRSSGFVVEDSGDDGVKSAKLPNAPKSETEPNGELPSERRLWRGNYAVNEVGVLVPFGFRLIVTVGLVIVGLRFLSAKFSNAFA